MMEIKIQWQDCVFMEGLSEKNKKRYLGRYTNMRNEEKLKSLYEGERGEETLA